MTRRKCDNCYYKASPYSIKIGAHPCTKCKRNSDLENPNAPDHFFSLFPDKKEAK